MGIFIGDLALGAILQYMVCASFSRFLWLVRVKWQFGLNTVMGSEYTGGCIAICNRFLPYTVNFGGAVQHSMVLRSETLLPATFGASCTPGEMKPSEI